MLSTHLLQRAELSLTGPINAKVFPELVAGALFQQIWSVKTLGGKYFTMLKIHVVKTDLNIIALAESFALFTRRRREIGPSSVALLQPANNFLQWKGSALRWEL